MEEIREVLLSICQSFLIKWHISKVRARNQSLSNKITKIDIRAQLFYHLELEVRRVSRKLGIFLLFKISSIGVRTLQMKTRLLEI